MSQYYEYTVSVDLSTAASSVSVDISAKASDVSVSQRSDYLYQTEQVEVDFPAQDSLRFWFDFSDPNCFDGENNTFVDLSGNGNDAAVIEIANGAYSSDVDDIAPFVGHDEQGTFIRIPAGSSNAIRWLADSTAPSQVSAFLVSKNEFQAEVEEGDWFDENGNLIPEQVDNIPNTISAAQFMTRDGGGLRFGAFNVLSSSYRYIDPDGSFNLNNSRVAKQRHTTFTDTDIDAQGFTFYNFPPDYVLAQPWLEETSGGYYHDAYNEESYFYGKTYPDQLAGVGLVRLQYTPYPMKLSNSETQIISVSLDGTEVSNHLNGREVSNQDIFEGRTDSNSGEWFAGGQFSISGVASEISAGGKFYALAVFDKVLTQDEHKQIYDYYNKATIRPSFVAVVPLSASVLVRGDFFEFSQAYGENVYTLLGGRQQVELSIDLASASPSESVSVDVSTKSESVSIDRSSHSAEVSITERFKTLWSFKSDFSTATSNEFPLITNELYDGQEEELYDFSYNQVGPDGEDGWLKVELKRDFKVGYNIPHSAGGNGDGFGPFTFSDATEPWDETSDGGSSDPSTYFKWTTKLDDYMSKGFDGQPTDAIYGRISFKISYSQLPAEEAPEALRPSPRMQISPLSATTNVSSWIGYEDPVTTYNGFTLNASHDSTAVPGITESFFHFDRTFLCGGNFEFGGAIPLIGDWAYPPYSSQILGINNRPWRQSLNFMKHDTEEVALQSSVVPQGFYIMIKDIEFSHFTGPSGLDVEPVSRSQQSKIPYEEGSGEERHWWNS